MNDKKKLDLGNNILIFQVDAIAVADAMHGIRDNIISQLNEGVLVIDKRLKMTILDNGGIKQWKKHCIYVIEEDVRNANIQNAHIQQI